jgi:hypothetical protein
MGCGFIRATSRASPPPRRAAQQPCQRDDRRGGLAGGGNLLHHFVGFAALRHGSPGQKRHAVGLAVIEHEIPLAIGEAGAGMHGGLLKKALILLLNTSLRRID